MQYFSLRFLGQSGHDGVVNANLAFARLRCSDTCAIPAQQQTGGATHLPVSQEQHKCRQSTTGDLFHMKNLKENSKRKTMLLNKFYLYSTKTPALRTKMEFYYFRS